MSVQTENIPLVNGMTSPLGSMDTWDVGAIIAAFLGSATIAGHADIEYAGYELATEWFSLGGSEVTFAAGIAALALIIAYITNQADVFSADPDMSQLEVVAVVVGLGAVAAAVVFPDAVADMADRSFVSWAYHLIVTSSAVTLATQ